MMCDRAAQELYALYAQHREKIADMRATCAAAVLQGCRDCSIDRSLKEICKAASPEKEMKKQLSKAHRDMMKVLQQRQHAEAKRRGINVEDLAEFSKARAALGGDEDAEKHKLHAANMVPRFGSDLGLTSRGIQVRPALAPPRDRAPTTAITAVHCITCSDRCSTTLAPRTEH